MNQPPRAPTVSSSWIISMCRERCPPAQPEIWEAQYLLNAIPKAACPWHLRICSYGSLLLLSFSLCSALWPERVQKSERGTPYTGFLWPWIQAWCPRPLLTGALTPPALLCPLALFPPLSLTALPRCPLLQGLACCPPSLLFLACLTSVWSFHIQRTGLLLQEAFPELPPEAKALPWALSPCGCITAPAQGVCAPGVCASAQDPGCLAQSRPSEMLADAGAVQRQAASAALTPRGPPCPLCRVARHLLSRPHTGAPCCPSHQSVTAKGS